jgi:hypothetical protein
MTVITNTATRRDAEVKGYGERTTVEKHTETVEIESLANHSRKTLQFLAVYDPKTRFVAWTLGPEMTEPAQAEWLSSLWLVQDIGMVRINEAVTGIRLDIFKTRAEDFAKWKDTLFGTLTATTAQESTPVTCDEMFVRLSEHLGRDFFSRPGDASVGSPVRIVSAKHTVTGWELKLRSGVTADKAMVYLDPMFRILRMFRNDKLVYEAASDASKSK